MTFLPLSFHHPDELMPRHCGLVWIWLWIESPQNFVKYVRGNFYSFNTFSFHWSNKFSSCWVPYLKSDFEILVFPICCLWLLLVWQQGILGVPYTFWVVVICTPWVHVSIWFQMGWLVCNQVFCWGDLSKDLVCPTTLCPQLWGCLVIVHDCRTSSCLTLLPLKQLPFH